MPQPGPWIPAFQTLEDAHSIAYPFAADFAGVKGASNPSYDYRTFGPLVTGEQWHVWPDSKVSGSAITWTGTYGNDSYRYLRSVRRRNLTIVTLEDMQNFRALLPNVSHPGATLPPGAIGVEYEGGSPNPVADSVVFQPGVSGILLNDSLTPVAPTEPWHFEINAEPGLHATAFPASPYYWYGAREDVSVDPATWGQRLTGIVDTAGTIFLSDTEFTMDLDETGGFSVQIRPTVTSVNPAQDNWRWQPRIDSATMRGWFTWPAYRHIYPNGYLGGGMWNLRQPQSRDAVAGSWPLRGRQNGGATGAWPSRSQ